MKVMIETCCGIDVHQVYRLLYLDGPLESNKPKKIQKKYNKSSPKCLSLDVGKSRHTCLFEKNWGAAL